MFAAEGDTKAEGDVRGGRRYEGGRRYSGRNIEISACKEKTRAMNFDRFALAFLRRRDPSQHVPGIDVDATQDAHMAHLAAMHDAGVLLAAGPVIDQELRGTVIFTCSVDEARIHLEEDPAVQAGWFAVEVFEWMVPGGAIKFNSTVFPRSMKDAQ
jgi:uncharacterized protein YciI